MRDTDIESVEKKRQNNKNEIRLFVKQRAETLFLQVKSPNAIKPCVSDALRKDGYEVGKKKRRSDKKTSYSFSLNNQNWQKQWNSRVKR